MTRPIRVLLVDDHAVVREGYRRLLEATDRVAVVAEAADVQQAYLACVELQPDVVVLDINLPGASGFEFLRRILARDPGTRVLVFSMHEDPVFVSRALAGGARGYLTKASAPELMCEAVLAIASGERYLPEALAEALRTHRSLAGETQLDILTEREFEILRLMAEGLGAGEIADRLHVSGKTVANYQTGIRHKLGAESLRDLMRIALRSNLLGADAQAGRASGIIPLDAASSAGKVKAF